MRLVLGIIFLLTVIAFQNCGMNKSGGSPFNINLASSTSNNGSSSSGILTPLSVSSLKIPTATYAPGSSMSLTASLIGSNLNSVSCVWTVFNSANKAVGTSSIVAASVGGTACATTLTAPAAVGSYSVSLNISNSGGENSSALMAFTVQGTVVVPPVPTPTPSPTPPTTCIYYYNGVPINICGHP